jgi:hypothetical protein
MRVVAVASPQNSRVPFERIIHRAKLTLCILKNVVYIDLQEESLNDCYDGRADIFTFTSSSTTTAPKSVSADFGWG